MLIQNALAFCTHQVALLEHHVDLHCRLRALKSYRSKQVRVVASRESEIGHVWLTLEMKNFENNFLRSL